MNDLCARVCLVITVIAAVAGASDTQATWGRSQPTQTLHSLMMSIDERLRTLEVSRWETLLKSLEQRLDTLETSFRRLDTAFHDRLDKLDRNLNSMELKDELSVEKLSHKVRDFLDSSYDRYNRRLGYAEERIEISLKKVQMTMESSFTRVEKQTEDVQAEVLEAVSLLEDLKSHSTVTEDKLNSTHKAIQQHIQSVMSPNHEELQRISGSLNQLGSRLNGSLTWTGGSQNDGPPAADLITTIRQEISTEANKLTSKVNNMYNDVWRRLIFMESLVKDVSKMGNTTYRQVLEEVRSLTVADRREFPGDSQENFLEVALDALERKLQRKLLDLGRKIDDRLDALSATQSLIMDGCFDGGTCSGLEARLSQVLERIFDVFSEKIDGSSNRTFELDSLVLEMMELVKTQHSQLIRTVTHNTNMVVTLAKDSSDAGKLLHKTVSQLADKTDYNFQELHDEVQEISSSGVKICSENEKTNEENNGHHTTMLTDTTLKNIPEIKVFTSSTQPNTPKKNNSEVKVLTISVPPAIQNTTKYDAGVIKITNDFVDVLADNTTSLNNSDEANKTIVVDRSIMEIVSTMYPNLTETQMNNFLNYLNNSMSLDNLEAIIQNTEAVEDDELTPDETSVEIDDPESLNKTNEVEKINSMENKIAHMFLFGNSDKNDVMYDLTKGDDKGEQQPKTDDTVQNVTISPGINNITLIDNTIKNNDLPKDVKDELKMYSLLMIIKRGHFNFTHLRNHLQPKHNQRVQTVTEKSLPVLEMLCYGKKNTKEVPTETIINLMTERLLLVNQTINDIGLYGKIENICNTMIESVHNYQTEKPLEDRTENASED